MQIRFRNDPSSIDMCEREALCHERRQSQQFIGNSLRLRCDECMLTSVGMRQVQHAQPNGADTVYGPVELLYEQPASPFEIYQAMNPSRSDLKQRITENNIASAEAASPHDDFDDDDFLSNPADIPVDPNSEVHQSITVNDGILHLLAASRKDSLCPVLQYSLYSNWKFIICVNITG